MSHDPSSILDALGQIPKGTSLTLSVHMDIYPTPHVALTRTTDRGTHMERLIAKGHGANQSLEVACAQAINEALADLTRQSFEADQRAIAAKHEQRGIEE